MFQLFLFIYLFILSTSLATPMQFFTLIFLILFFFSKFNHLQTGWFRSGRLDQSRANTDGYKLHLKDFAIFWCFLFCILTNPNLQGIDFFFFFPLANLGICYRFFCVWIWKFVIERAEGRAERWEEWGMVWNLEPVWPTKNGHSISVTQFSSLITHHSFFHTHLATSFLFSSLNFFTLFMGPTPVSRYIFFFFPVPNSPKLILLKKKKNERPT